MRWQNNCSNNFVPAANEITGITNSVGTAWVTPTYDPARNMAGIPNPQLLTAQYDAWNRLVRITNGATTICENAYDARGYRIRKDTYTSDTLTERNITGLPPLFNSTTQIQHLAITCVFLGWRSVGLK